MRDQPADDVELLARLREGDEQAFRDLLGRYERLIYAGPRRMGLSAEDSADVFQDVVVALLHGMRRIRDPRTLPRWLAQTAFRIARDRKARGRREVRPEDDAFWELRSDEAPGADELLMDFEARLAVRDALARIPARCRSLLESMFLLDPAPSYRELSARLGIPIGSLGPTRQRCLSRLLPLLAERGITPARRPTLRGSAPQPGAPKRRAR